MPKYETIAHQHARGVTALNKSYLYSLKHETLEKQKWRLGWLLKAIAEQ